MKSHLIKKHKFSEECIKNKNLVQHFNQTTIPTYSNINRKILYQYVAALHIDCRPLRFGDGYGFSSFFDTLHIKLPTYKQISDTTESIISLIKRKMECDIENTKFVNIQMDHWKGKSTNYLAIFVDFMKDMNIISYLLYIQQVDNKKSETTSIILNNLQNTILHNKMITATSDSASDMLASIKMCSFIHIHCFSHRIHNSLLRSEVIIKTTMKKFSKLLDHINRKDNFYDELRKVLILKYNQEKLNIITAKIPSAIDVRWFSSYDMLQHFVESFSDIRSYIQVIIIINFIFFIIIYRLLTKTTQKSTQIIMIMI